MKDFGTTLTMLFDDVASTIEPRLNFEAVLHGEIPQQSSDVRPHRPAWQTLGYAAASVALVAGAVVTLDYALGRDDGSVATSDQGQLPAWFDPAWYGLEPASWPGRGQARPSTNEPERPVVVAPVPTEPTTTIAAPATSAPVVETQPAAEPTTTTPVAAPSAAKLGWSSTTTDPMKQALYGTAAPNEKITITSPFGEVTTRPDRHGEWSTVLVLTGVPWGTTVTIVVTLMTSGTTFTFEIVRPPQPTTTTSTTTTTTTLPPPPPPPPTTVKPVEQPAPTEPKPEPTQPAPVAFTSNLGFADLAASPMKQIFTGTGTPGSVVRADSAYGAAEAVVSSKGKWELKLKMYEVPVGTAVGVRVTNNASDGVFEYTLVKQPPPAPPEIDFIANAAFTECDAPVPFNEYWGKSTAGAAITISSPYGGGQTTSNDDGKWAARIEFPGAPVGETFAVTITSSKGSAVYNFSMVSTRTV